LVVYTKGQHVRKGKNRLQEQRVRWSRVWSRIDGWRVGKVKVSTGQKMLNAFTDGILVC
jgi:hypothetical protein